MILSNEDKRWISVDERLPDKGQSVLCYTDDRQIAQGSVNRFTRGRVEVEYVCSGPACYGDSPTVTHWMALPEPPTQESDR